MEFEGKVWKDPNSSWWLVEIFFLDVMTQGKTRKEALEMIKDAVMELLIDSYEDLLSKQFQLFVTLYKEGVIGLGASDETLLFALGLKRQRIQSGSTIRDVAKRCTSLKSYGTIAWPVYLTYGSVGWPSNSATTSQGSFKRMLLFDICRAQYLLSLPALS